MAGESRVDPLEGACSELAGREVLVALSGGPDSALVASLAKECAASARAIFIDHQWPDSATMQAAAEQVAHEIGMPLSVVSVSPGKGSSPEAQARHVRYAALEAALSADEFLVTGHNSNDQAETILFHLVRGSGPRGLSGMPQSRGRLLRPLLAVPRSAVLAGVAERGLPVINDPANASMDFARNRVRRVLPDLIEAVGVADHNPILRSGYLAAVEDDYLAALADSVPVSIDSDAVSVSLALLRVVPPPIRSRVLRSLFEPLRSAPGYFEEVQALEAMLTSGSSVDFAGGLRAIVSATTLTLFRPPGPWAGVEWVGAEIEVGGRWTLRRRTSDVPPSALPIGNGSAVFDADNILAPLAVRPANEHPSIKSGVGTKSVRDSLGEASVPVHLRDSWPVVSAGPDALWIPGVRRAATGFISASTRRYLSLHVVQEDKCVTQRF